MSAEAPRFEPLDLCESDALPTALAALGRGCDRLFRIVSPWAPGLAMVGAQADPTRFGASPGAPRLSATGAGETPAAAIVACLGEMAERISLCEQPDDIVERSVIATVADRVFPPMLETLTHRAARLGLADAPIDFVAVVETDGGRWLAPADDVLLRPRWCGLRDPHIPASLGAAAGPTFEDALRSAAFELCEREAAALWWRSGAQAHAQAHALAPDLARDIAAAVAALRGGARARATRFYDITRAGAPACVAVVTQDATRAGGFAVGAACRSGLESAARAALREAIQNEAGLMIARLRAGAGDPTPPSDAAHLRRDAWAGDARLLAAGPRQAASDDPSDALKYLIAKAHRLAVADLSRPGVGVPAVKAVALAPAAVAASPMNGGDGWTDEIPMF